MNDGKPDPKPNKSRSSSKPLFSHEDHLVQRDECSEQPTVVTKKHSVDRIENASLAVCPARELVGKTIGGFQLLEYLGGGGMGAVFRAVGTSGLGTVAIKVLRPSISDQEDLRRFRAEADILSRLNHKNIASIHQMGKDQGWNFLVLEYIPGKNLFQHVQENGPMDEETSIALFAQLADALQHAHEKGMIHRDLKPSNILLSEKGEVKLVDMGLALETTADPDDSDVDEKELTIGSVDYLSPEQARDPSSVDPQSDLYSLGCTMFFALTGKTPFGDRSTIKKLLNHSAPDRPSARRLNPSVSEAMDLLIQSLMAVNKSGRPKSAKEFQASLLKLSPNHAAGSNQGPANADSPSSPFQWKKLFLFSTFMLIAGFLLFVIFSQI